MAVDTSFYARVKSKAAFDREAEEFEARRQAREMQRQQFELQKQKYQSELNKPQYKTVGNTLGRLDPTTGAFEPVYTDESAALPKAPMGYRYTPDGSLAVIPGGPAAGPRKLSATEQKELFDTIDTMNSTQGAMSDLTRARNLLFDQEKGNRPFSGFGAETITDLNRVPVIGALIDDTRAAATTEYKNLVGSQALNNLKAIFGGMPTEGERQILMQLQALPQYTPEEQRRILDNAIAAADKRMTQNKNKAAALESGDRQALYSTPQQPVNAGGSGGWSIREIK